MKIEIFKMLLCLIDIIISTASVVIIGYLAWIGQEFCMTYDTKLTELCVKSIIIIFSIYAWLDFIKEDIEEIGECIRNINKE